MVERILIAEWRGDAAQENEGFQYYKRLSTKEET